MTTQQAPIQSGFGAESTARDVVAGQDLRGRLAIVSGGHAGIGLETTRALVSAGANVVVLTRSLDKARKNLAGLANVEIEDLDLAVPKSIDAFSRRFLDSKRAIHLLINNAGIMATEFERDARGFETQLATNHLGHFQLTARLWPALVAAKGARVVSVSSRGHVRAGVDFDDPNFERRPYDKYVAYGQSKTANALFAVALDARGEAHDVRAFSLHPGAILTELTRSLAKDELDAAIEHAKKISPFKTPEQGAATSVWCATSPKLAKMGGVYCEDCDVAVPLPEGSSEPYGVRPWATDPALAERLWTLSEKWTDVKLKA